jgi:hypothetical protein
MKPPTSAPSAEPSSTTSRRRSTRNRHNLPTKNQMKNHPVVVGPKVLLVGQADRLGRLVDHPVDQVGPPEGAEDDGQRKAWIEPGKAQRQRKGEHRKDKRLVGNVVIRELPRRGLLGNPDSTPRILMR